MMFIAFMMFIVGMFIGATIGVFVMALVSANSRFKKDDDCERIDKER